MGREHVSIRRLISLLLLLLHFGDLCARAEESGNVYSRGCARLSCEGGGRCVKRRFWCKDPPCPGMLYCSKSRKETLRGPLTCDTVRCSGGHTCVVKVRGCRWDGNCRQRMARCISEREYHEGAASCAGFVCPSGKRCILRETLCADPPCKLIRSCSNATEAKAWLDECRASNCTSEYECFLRRPEDNCRDSECAHTPDCSLTVEDELVGKYCHGWICPRAQKCSVQIVGSCKGFNCTVRRLCRASTMASVKHEVAESEGKTLARLESESIRRELDDGANARTNRPIAREKPTLAATSTRRQSIRRTTTAEHEAEVSLTRQEIATTKMNLITRPSTNDQRHSTLPYLQFSNGGNLTTTDTIDEDESAPEFSDSPGNSNPSGATLPVDRKIETTEKETPKRVGTTDDTLPFPRVSVNFVGPRYPIWIKDDPFYSSAKDKDNDEDDDDDDDEDGDGWTYREPQESYEFLLPPYEPVIIVEDSRMGHEQLLPFFTYAFDYPFDGAAPMPPPEITSAGIRADRSSYPIKTERS